MRAALLTVTDLGPPYQIDESASGGQTDASGCEPLATMLNSPTDPQRTQVRADFAGGDNGPFIEEAITTEDQRALPADYARVQTALTQCQSLTFTSGNGDPLTFTVSQIDLGAGPATAVRLDGTFQGTQVNGYLAIDKIGPVVLTYDYVQVGSGSSQEAAAFFAQAVSKAQDSFEAIVS
jgi:hypothetical protein